MAEPQRITDSHVVDIRDHIFPWKMGQPVLARMEGTNDLFLLLFSTMQMLSETMTEMDIPYESVKRVDDPVEFLGSLPLLYDGGRLRVIINPHMTSRQTMKYSELIRQTIH